jgi:hypothetical protein
MANELSENGPDTAPGPFAIVAGTSVHNLQRRPPVNRDIADLSFLFRPHTDDRTFRRVVDAIHSSCTWDATTARARSIRTQSNRRHRSSIEWTAVWDTRIRLEIVAEGRSDHSKNRRGRHGYVPLTSPRELQIYAAERLANSGWPPRWPRQNGKTGNIWREKPLTSLRRTIQMSSSRDLRGHVFAHRGQFRRQVRASVYGHERHGLCSASFEVGDILTRSAERYDAILCRGVLNDLVDDSAREAAFDAFASALQPRGVLILDVREWDASAARKAREPIFRKRVSTDRGELTKPQTAA